MSKSHNNKVTISCASIASIEYIDNSLIITEGQPSSLPLYIHQKGNDWIIEIKCGRKGSTGVSSAFTNQSGGQGHIFSPSCYLDEKPSKLNFSFSVQINFQIGGAFYHAKLNLAQGHTGASNNWWIGGHCMAKSNLGVLNLASAVGDKLIETYVISGGTSDFNLTPLLKTTPNREHHDWLKNINDEELIGNINLPGTHDTVAINRYIYTPYACQSKTISAQLRDGIRVFDIRISVHENDGVFSFMTCHGNWGPDLFTEYQTLSSALDECSSFLSSYPTEFIAILLQIDDWNGNPESQGAYDSLAEMIYSYPYAESASIPKLKDVRGRMYYMNRITVNDQLGVPVKWVTPTAGSYANANPNRRYDIYVQDQHNNLDLPFYTQYKYDLFIDAIPFAPRGGVLLNYASATTPILTGVYIMPLFLQFIGNSHASERPLRLGWSMFDYVSTTYSTNEYGQMDVIDIIISSNFQYSEYEKPFKVNGQHEAL